MMSSKRIFPPLLLRGVIFTSHKKAAAAEIQNSPLLLTSSSSSLHRSSLHTNCCHYSSACLSITQAKRSRNSFSYSRAAVNSDDADSDNDINNNSKTCHLSKPLVIPGTPLPPPLPEPNYSFRCRALPSNLIAFDSTMGKERFMYALRTNFAESYFPLSQQFLNQFDPAYCGITTLVLILNALAIDPNVRWRGGWRWYGDEQMLLERCCLEKERVEREGVTLEQFCGLARCQGVIISKKRPSLFLDRGEPEREHHHHNYDVLRSMSSLDAQHHQQEQQQHHDINEFRNDIINAVRMPPRTDYSEEETFEQNNYEKLHNNCHASSDNKKNSNNYNNGGGYFLVTSFARQSLSQTGDGHFSPIAAYHEPSDSCLVLDVARFKYTPYWVAVQDLYDAMIPEDKATGQSRGWLLMYPPTTKGKYHHHDGAKKSWTVDEIEGRRPAACVPLAGSGVPLCAVEQMKVDYCSVNNKKCANIAKR